MPAIAVLVTGCRSVSSTIMDRTPSDNLVAESNGDRCQLDQAAPYRGIPVVVQIPTHVDVQVVETLLFFEKDLGKAGKQLSQLKPTKRQIDLDATIRKSDKLFFVDFKRPAAGTLDYTIDYGDGKSQYFKSIKYKAVDETISDVNAALTTVFGSGTTQQQKKGTTPKRTLASKDDGKDESPIKATTRVLAWKRFDINEPDFELSLMEFVNLHVNDCHECGPDTTCHNVNVSQGE